MNVSLGEIVFSKAGRDSGKRFVVLEVLDESYVTISDGELRKVEKPKRKKLKHLVATGEVIKSLNEKLNARLKVTNSELRKALSAADTADESEKSV